MKAKGLLVILGILALAVLTIAAVFPTGYLGSRVITKEYYVPAAGLTITVPDGANAQYCSMINSGDTSHVSTGAVWFTIGDGNQAAPTIAVPTAGNPTVGSYFVIGQSGDIPAGFKAIKLKTDTGLVAYVRITLIY